MKNKKLINETNKTFLFILKGFILFGGLFGIVALSVIISSWFFLLLIPYVWIFLYCVNKLGEEEEE